MLIRAHSYLADAGKARLPVVCSPRDDHHNADSASWSDSIPMQAENADSAGLNRFQIWPATFARSPAHAQ